MDVTYVTKNQRRYGIFSIIVGTTFLWRIFLVVKVQGGTNIQDLKSWLEFLQSTLAALEPRGREVLAATWEGTYGHKEIMHG